MRGTSSRLLIGLAFTLLILGSCPSNRGSTNNKASTRPSVVMTTDKTHYSARETVTLKVTNHLGPIWYIGYPQRDLVWWDIEKAQDNAWNSVHMRMPLIEGGVEACRLILYEQPIGEVTELKSGSALRYEWNQHICLFDTGPQSTQPELIERGRYRCALRYSVSTVNTPGIETQPWKRPTELAEVDVIYSNEFFLE